MIWYCSLAAMAMAAGLHLWLGKRPVSRARVMEILLLYLLVIFVGVGGLMGFLGHTFMAREIAMKIGWQPSPFQFEVAAANLAFGILGIMCLWVRGSFWTATGVGWSVFLLGCAYGHLRDMLVLGNYAAYNSGAVLWLNDLAIPAAILILLGGRRYAPSSHNEGQASKN